VSLNLTNARLSDLGPTDEFQYSVGGNVWVVDRFEGDNTLIHRKDDPNDTDSVPRFTDVLVKEASSISSS